MKRIIILLHSLFFGLMVFSQVSLTSVNNAPVPGDSNSYIKIPWVDPGGAGPDQVWDFSGISMTGEKLVSKINSPAPEKEKVAVDYTIIVSEPGSEFFCRLNGDQFMEVGGMKNEYSITYSDPVVRMIYPLSFGNHFTDNFAGEGSVRKVKKVDFTGVYSVTADAFGTLILPDRAFLDVLRVRTESDGLEINQCNTVEVKIVHYIWYAPGRRYPVLNVSTTERRVSGKDAGTTKTALLWTGSTGSTPEGKGQPEGLANTDGGPVVVAYPNPFGDNLNYYYFLRKPVPLAITMTDVTGRTSAVLMKQQMQGEGLHTGSIDPAEFSLTPGIYYLRFVFDQQVVVKKVIKL
jgi:hypothetical protein